MPDRYVREMVADWASAGYCQNGKLEVVEWYYDNKYGMTLHPQTRKRVEELLGIALLVSPKDMNGTAQITPERA